MTPQDIVAAIGLPDSCIVEQRVPKKLLLESIAATVSDKRLIADGIEEIRWIAALKPNTTGVPAFCDDVREYAEISLLEVVLRVDIKSARLVELVHRAIPYPLVLMIVQSDVVIMSLAHKRRSQNEEGKVVLDATSLEIELPDSSSNRDPVYKQFLQALAINAQPRNNLYTLYQGWMDAILALQAAALTGTFIASTSREQAIARHQALNQCRELDEQIAGLRSAANKEQQIARQVAINLEIKALLAERQQLSTSL